MKTPAHRFTIHVIAATFVVTYLAAPPTLDLGKCMAVPDTGSDPREAWSRAIRSRGAVHGRWVAPHDRLCRHRRGERHSPGLGSLDPVAGIRVSHHSLVPHGLAFLARHARVGVG